MFMKEPGRRHVACAKNGASFMFFDNSEISLSYSFSSSINEHELHPGL